MRGSLFTLLVSSSLLLTSSLVDARTLSSTSDWSVNKVSATQGGAYCTLARQYETDSVVTFARNAKGEGTIALDFQRNVFDITRAYPITLQAGNVLRQYVIKPANDSAIIMRTSTDASLFNAMRDHGSLRVQIDNENFTINLSGYADSLNKLNDCVGLGKTVTAQIKTPRPPKDMTNQVSAQEGFQNQDRAIEKLVDENAKLVRELESERISFRQKLASSTPSQPVDIPQRAAVPPIDNGLMEKLITAEKRNSDLLRRVTTLETQLASRSAQLNPDLSSALKERQTQIDLLNSEKRRMEALLNEERTKRVSLEAEIVSLRANAGQSNQVSNTRLTQELEKQVASLTTQNNTLRKQLNDAKTGEPNVIIKEIIKEVPVASAGTPEQVVALNERLAEVQTSALSMKAERDEYRSLLQRERQRLKEMSDLGQQVSSAGSTSNNMVAEIQKLEAEKIDLIRQLEFAKTGATPVSTQNGAVQSRLEEVMQESEQAKQQLRILSADKKALEDKLHAAEIAAVEAKRTLSNAKMNHMSKGSISNEVSILESEIASLEAQNRMLREDLAANIGREQSIDRSSSQNMIAALEEKYSKRMNAIENENIRLTQELNQKNNETPEPTETKEKIEILSTPTADSSLTKEENETVTPVQVAEARISPNEARRQLRNKITGKSIPTPKTKQVAKVVSSSADIQKQPSSMAPKMAALSGDEIRQLVMNAQIPLASSIERVSNISGPDFAAFRWDTGTVYGSAEQSKLANIRAFETAVTQYISKTENRCGGEFDKTLIPVSTANGLTARAADIACIQNSDNGAAASLVFFAHDNMFYAVAHEADLNGFQVAMDHRDQLINQLASVF